MSSDVSYRRLRLPHRNQGGQTVIVHAAQHEVHVLNGTASLIWELLGDWRTPDEVVAALGNHGDFDVGEEEVQRDVVQFLDHLLDKGLVTGATPTPSPRAR